MKLTKIVYALTAIFLIAASAEAQGRNSISNDDQSRYVVSAKAGVVNVVEGDVSFERGGKVDMLLTTDALRAGDVVRTGGDGRAEILLNPGSYLRLSANSEFTFSDTRLHRLGLNISKGSAIIEASMIVEAITVVTPHGEFPIVDGGLYRFNVGANEGSEVIARKGKVQAPGVTVKEGKRAMIGPGAPVVTSFDKKSEDDFDLWSKERAKIIVAANNKLSNRALRRNSSLSLSGNSWIFNPFIGTYTYLPGYWGIYSPYGYGYNICNPYSRWNNPCPQGDCGGYGGRGDSTGGSGSGSTTGYPGGNGSPTSGPGSGGIGNGSSDRGVSPPPVAPPSSSRGRVRDH
jgi:hypothetical protein